MALVPGAEGAELRRELRRLGPGPTVALGIGREPWPVGATGAAASPPGGADAGGARAALEGLLEVAQETGRELAPRLLVATSSEGCLRDLDLLRALDRQAHLRIGVELGTLDPELSARLDPGSTAPERRLEVLRELSRAGLCAGVLLMPIYPELTESPRALRRVVCQARMAGARWLSARVLDLPGQARADFFAWLVRERPDLLRSYARMYRGWDPVPPEPVLDRIRRVVVALRTQYDLPAWVPLPPAPCPQRELFAPAPAPPEVAHLPSRTSGRAAAEPAA